MYQGKFFQTKHMKHGRNRITAILLAMVLLISAGVVGTIAYLQMSTPHVANTFTPAGVPIEIHEDPHTAPNWIKEDVYVTNIGTAAAYIRVAVAATWRDKDGNIAPFSVAEGDYTITLPAYEEGKEDLWQKYGNYYYYKAPVDPTKSTDILFKEVSYEPKGDYVLHFEIAASSIQAEGLDDKGNKPIELAWGVDIEKGVIKDASINKEVK